MTRTYATIDYGYITAVTVGSPVAEAQQYVTVRLGGPVEGNEGNAGFAGITARLDFSGEYDTATRTFGQDLLDGLTSFLRYAVGTPADESEAVDVGDDDQDVEGVRVARYLQDTVIEDPR